MYKENQGVVTVLSSILLQQSACRATLDGISQNKKAETNIEPFVYFLFNWTGKSLIFLRERLYKLARKSSRVLASVHVLMSSWARVLICSCPRAQEVDTLAPVIRKPELDTIISNNLYSVIILDA